MLAIRLLPGKHKASLFLETILTCYMLQAHHIVPEERWLRAANSPLCEEPLELYAIRNFHQVSEYSDGLRQQGALLAGCLSDLSALNRNADSCFCLWYRGFAFLKKVTPLIETCLLSYCGVNFRKFSLDKPAFADWSQYLLNLFTTLLPPWVIRRCIEQLPRW